MTKHFKITIQSKGTRKMVMEATIISNDFDEHDTVAHLFALEFAANSHAEIPMRVHISEEVK